MTTRTTTMTTEQMIELYQNGTSELTDDQAIQIVGRAWRIGEASDDTIFPTTETDLVKQARYIVGMIDYGMADKILSTRRVVIGANTEPELRAAIEKRLASIEADRGIAWTRIV